MLDLGEDIVIQLGDSVQLEGLVNFIVDSLNWTPNTDLNPSNSLSPFVQPLENTTYFLTAFDSLGCSASDDINIIVQELEDFFAPTAFSPNDDGVNDRFLIFAGQSVAQIKDFQIFDRWGNQLYQNGPFAPNDPQFGWDGTHRGQMMNTGVYVYYVELEMVDGRTEVIKGDVLLVK